MATVVGGVRARLIREAVFRMLQQSLEDLGWFDSGRPHTPIIFESRARNQNEQIEINTAALSDEMSDETSWELGSQLTENTWQMYVDFFAENDAVGLDLIRDIQDILRGRFTVIGRSQPIIDVYDLRQATPPFLFSCEIEEVRVDRAHGFTKPWLEHWYACSFVVLDYYDSDEG